MKPIKKKVHDDEPNKLSQYQLNRILKTQFDGKSLEDIQKEAEEAANDIDNAVSVMTFLPKGSLVHYDESGTISSINNAEVTQEYKGKISYEHFEEVSPNGDAEVIGLTIEIEDDVYLGKIFHSVPYGIIKKNRTGVGATSLEIDSPRNSIIVVPTKSLAYTKALTGYHPDTGKRDYLYVGSEVERGIDFPSLEDYITDQTITYKKIIVVADSLWKVIAAIGERVYNSYFIMFDEIDIFQSDSTFRPALENAMDYYFKFNSNNRCLVSATIQSFCNPAINCEPVINLTYSQSNKRSISSLIHTDNPHAIIKEKIEHIFTSNPEEKILIAYNKIKYIRQVIENLNPECKRECGILCSEASKDHAEPYYKEMINNSLPARITFATNPFFAGIDIKESFHLISVSNAKHIYTLLSPDRYLQIAGRCRKPHRLLSETIVYNVQPYKSKYTPDSYGKHLLEMAEEVCQYINKADELARRYKSYELFDETFDDVKESISKKLDRSYFGTKMPLVRKNVFKPVYNPSYFNIDSIYDALRLHLQLYAQSDNLYNVLKDSCDIPDGAHGTQNREYTSRQRRNEALADMEYRRIDDDSIAQIIEEIRNVASDNRLNNSQFTYWLRSGTRQRKQFVKCVKALHQYIPLDKLLDDLIPVFKDQTSYQGYHNAAIFWALDESHPFKVAMKTAFPENSTPTNEEVRDRMNDIYRQFFDKPISQDTPTKAIKILGEYFATGRAVRGTRRVILSHNKNNYTGEPLRRIPVTENIKPLLEFSGEVNTLS